MKKSTRAWKRLWPLVAASLLLASCEKMYESSDREFGQSMQRQLAADFRKQAESLATPEKQPASAPAAAAAVPENFAPAWKAAVAAPAFASTPSRPVTLEELFVQAMTHSNQIRVFSEIPLVRETGIQEAIGRFDHHVFVETHYEFRNDPVGSTLTTGGPDRFRQNETVIEGGVKRTLETGADVRLSERIARTDNNSEFTEPNPQATARLGLSINQPLLRGGGVEYNRATIRIAKFDSQAARQEFLRQSEGHLLEIARAYWTLYLARAEYVQKVRLTAETADLVKKIEGRKDLDTTGGDVALARAALSRRQADLVRQEMAVKNLEDRLKALVNSPDLLVTQREELLPTDKPSLVELQVTMEQAANEALENRPEIQQSFLQMRSAAMRLDVAKNEIMPQLDLILETSIAGIDSAGPITNAMDDQWVHPGYLIGLRFDWPVENNAAKANLTRRKVELRQQLEQLRATIDTVLLEVKISAREVKTSQRELRSRYESLLAAQEDLRVLRERWDTHAGADGKAATPYLQLLLDSQDRLYTADENFVTSLVSYNLSMLNLQRAQGTLLKYEDVQIVRTEDKDKVPSLRLEKRGEHPAAAPKK